MDKNKLTLKESSIAYISGFIICQLVVLLTSMIILFIGSSFNISNIENFSKTCFGNLILTSALYLAMFFVFKFFNKNKENKIISKPSTIKCLIYTAIAIVSFFALYPIVNSFDYLLTHLGFKANVINFNFTLTNYIICLLPMVILPAMCEELMFRGLIFKGLKRYGKTSSLVLTSLMFAIYHMSLQQTLHPILFGLLLTFVMYKENNIIYCIIMHFTNNLLALTFMFLKINLFVSKLWYYILSVILLAIFVILLIYFIKKQKNVENIEKINKNNKILLIIVLFIMFILWLISNIYR